MRKTLTLSILLFFVCTTFWAQQGLQITAENTEYFIDFEDTMENVVFGDFRGTGFHPDPGSNGIDGIGQLDSDTWEVLGLSDGDLLFGGSANTGDFARGLTAGNVPVGIGGIYAFELYPTNNVLGVQATTADCTPGSIGMRVQNQTGTTISSLKISYITYTYNDQPGSGYFSMSHSADNSSYTEILESNIITDNAPAAEPDWIAHNFSFKISGLSIADGGFYYIRWNIKNNSTGELDQFGIDDIGITANPAMGAYVYADNMDGISTNDWYPSDPNLVSNLGPETSISVQNGTATLSQDLTIKNLSVSAGATLNIQKTLFVEDAIVNNGSIVFQSNSISTGQLGKMDNGANITGSGSVTVQRYLPARNDGKGAYRYLSSAVNSSGSINADWQEGASSMANPNPGFGMFITGSADGSNGFDATPAGAPSMFTFNNASQEYVAVSSTSSSSLMAGTPYSVYVWGDRSVDILTSNDPVATSTTLQATGNLIVGDHPVSLEGDSGDFNLFGNPYQAIVNMPDVMALSTNVNPNFYYVWDPNYGERGAYATVNLNNGTNNTGENSEANQYLMPGQAAWVISTTSGAVLNFTEDAKSILSEETDVFRTESTNSGFIGLQLFQSDRFANGEALSDAIRVNFSEDGNNSVQLNDAPKLDNLDENIGLNNEGQILSIADRAFPVNGEVLPISTTQYRTSNYVFNAIVSNLPADTKAYLKDNYLQTQTELINNGTTPVSFSVDASNTASIATDRFSLVFERSPLGVNEEIAQTLSIYPNPVQNGQFFIAAQGISGEKVQISLFNVLGQEVYRSTIKNANDRINVPTTSLKAGIYVVKMEHNGKTFTGKVVVQ